MTTHPDLRCPKCGATLTSREPDSGGMVRCHCGALFAPGAPTRKTVELGSAVPAARASEEQAQGANAAPRSSLEQLQGRVLSGKAVVARPLVRVLMVPLCGLVVTIAIYALCWIALRDSFIGAVLMDRGWVPYVVMFLAAWSGCDLAVKQRRLKREFSALQLDLMPTELGDRITQQNAGQFREHASNVAAAARGTLITRRLQKALHHFETRGSAQELSEYLSRLSESDQARADSRYSMVRVFIWAIPILGFIGTVLGIGEAVGMFSDAIDASGELQAIKDSLGGVTTGLAWAFDTTLVALVVSLIVMFPASTLQSREEGLVGEVDEYCDEHLVRRLREEGAGDPLSQVVEAAVERGLDLHAQRMQGWTERVAGVADTLTDQLAAGWHKVAEQSSAHYADMLARASTHHAELLAHSSSAQEQARSEGRELVDATREALSEFAASRVREGERLESLLTRWQEQQAQAQIETAAAGALLTKTLAGAQEAMTRDAEAARQAVESTLASLAPQVAGQLATIGERASEVWSQQLERLAASQERATADLRSAQESVNQSTTAGAQQLAGWGAELQAAIAAAGEALQTQVQEASEAQVGLAEAQREAAREAAESQGRVQESVNQTTAAGAEQLAAWGAELQAAIAAAGEVLRAQGQDAGEAQARLAEAQREAAREAAAGLEHTQELVSQAMAADAQSLSGWGAELQAAIAAAGEALKAQVQEAGEAQARLADAQCEAAREAAQETAVGLARTSERMESGLERQVAAIDESRQEQSAAMADAAGRIAAALEQAQGKLNSQAQALSDAAAGHEQLVALQRGLAANLETLARSESLAQALAGLEERLALLDRTLTGIDARTNGRQGLLGRLFSGNS